MSQVILSAINCFLFYVMLVVTVRDYWRLHVILVVYRDFRGGPRAVKLGSFRKRRPFPANYKQTTSIEMKNHAENSTAEEVVITSDNIEIETTDNTDAGWKSILIAVLKILILGIAVFIYDIYSK